MTKCCSALYGVIVSFTSHSWHDDGAKLAVAEVIDFFMSHSWHGDGAKRAVAEVTDSFWSHSWREAFTRRPIPPFARPPPFCRQVGGSRSSPASRAPVPHALAFQQTVTGLVFASSKAAEAPVTTSVFTASGATEAPVTTGESLLGP